MFDRARGVRGDVGVESGFHQCAHAAQCLGWLAPDVVTHHLGRGSEQAQQQADGGGLAGPVGSQKVEYLSPMDLHVEVVDGRQLFEALGQVVGEDDDGLIDHSISLCRYVSANLRAPPAGRNVQAC